MYVKDASRILKGSFIGILKRKPIRNKNGTNYILDTWIKLQECGYSKSLQFGDIILPFIDAKGEVRTGIQSCYDENDITNT